MKILTNKEYEELKAQYGIIEEYKKTCNELVQENKNLKNRLKDRSEIVLKKYLNENFKYAIFTDGLLKTELYNDGRWEKGVSRISFNSNKYGEVPELTIWK